MKKFKGPYELQNQRMVYFNTVTQNYYDPTLDIELPAHKVNDIGFVSYHPLSDIQESRLTEVAPPSKEAEEWITSNKDNFKKQYGDNWESVLYATAWKRFGKSKDKLKEHKNPDYINAWKDKGFDITVTNMDDPNNPNAIAFEVKKDDLDITIIEPQDGEYYIFGHKDKYTSFDDAMNGYINQTLPDSHLREQVNRLAEMSGAKDTLILEICKPQTEISEDLYDIFTSSEVKKIKKDVYELGVKAGKQYKSPYMIDSLKEYLKNLDYDILKQYKNVIQSAYEKGVQHGKNQR